MSEKDKAPGLITDADTADIESWPKYRKTAEVTAKKMDRDFSVETLEGVMTRQAGDYLVGPGAEGEFWPVKASIFEATHDSAERIDPVMVKQKAFKTLIDNLGEEGSASVDIITGACRTLEALRDVTGF